MLITTAQAYFTWQNYHVNKQRFINDVQIALDLSIEKYFADKARHNLRFFKMELTDTIIDGQRATSRVSAVQDVDSLLERLNTNRDRKTKVALADDQVQFLWISTQPDSGRTPAIDSMISSFNAEHVERIDVLKEYDTSLNTRFQHLTSKVMLSINEDLVDLGKLYTAVMEELKRKSLEVEFALRQQNASGSTSVGTSKDSYLTTQAKSSYLGPRRSIAMDFENATLAILQRGLTELGISVLLVGWVMGAMITLYRTIRRQKQVAAIKDDLISNITHEFKTPIATVFSALEGITHFNANNDPDKTKRYLAIGTDQLTRLNGMVEKLLETAAIDQGKLQMNREEVELVAWTQGIVERFRLVAQDKVLTFESSAETAFLSVDPFHLENTIANLIDNALKYGGNQITVRLLPVAGPANEQTVWQVEDDGGNIPKAEQARIFDKLYRIPTGNQHDVKGFGIGLFYARSVAQLHGGTLTLTVAPNKTLFEIKL